MSAGSIVVDLLLKTGSFSTDAQRSAKDLEKLKKQAHETGAALGNALKDLAAAAGVTLTFAGIGALVKGAIDAADHLNDLSKKTGIAVETLGGIGFAAGLAGGDLNSVAAAAGKLNKSLAEAAAGNKDAAEAFNVLGIAVKDTGGATRKTDEVLADIADRFAEYEDGPEKAALALKIFGKAGADIIPLLDDGGRALRENIEYYQRFAGVTADVAAQADQFNDTMAKSSLIAGAFGRQLAADLLPALQAVADEFLAAKEGSDAFKTASSGLRTIFETLVILASDVAFVFGGIGRELGAIAAQAGALLRRDFAGFTAISDAVKADGERARAELDKFQARVLQATEAPTGSFRPSQNYGDRLAPGKRAAPRLSGGGDAKVSEAQRYLEALQKQLEKTQELSVVEQTLTDIQKNRIDGLTPKIKEQILATAALVDVGKHQQDQLKAEKQQFDDFVEFRKKQADALAESTKRLTEENQALADEIAIISGGEPARRAIEAARASSAIAIKEEARALAQLQGAKQPELDALDKEIALLRVRQSLLGGRNVADDLAVDAKQRLALFAEVGDTIASGFEDAIVAGKGLRGVLDGIGKDLLRMAVRENFTKPFAEFLSGAGGGGGGLIGSLFKMFGGAGSSGAGISSADAAFALGSANGNAFDGGRVLAFAKGGILDGPTYFGMAGGRVGVGGEAGTEAILPLKRGSDGKLGVASTGGGRAAPAVVNNYLTVSGDPNPATLAAMQSMLAKSNQQLVRGLKTGAVGGG